MSLRFVAQTDQKGEAFPLHIKMRDSPKKEPSGNRIDGPVTRRGTDAGEMD